MAWAGIVLAACPARWGLTPPAVYPTAAVGIQWKPLLRSLRAL